MCETSSIEAPRKPQGSLRGCLGVLLGLGGVVGLLVGLILTRESGRSPFGRSHACDKILAVTLQNYAEAHDGWFPLGEASAEASLSLLAKHWSNPRDAAQILHGKSIPLDLVEARLAAGKLLSPTTCGWRYVEGLRKKDNPQLALFWDKAGLGHNGQSLPQGGHYVGRVNGFIDYVPGDQWNAFVAEQQTLLEQIPPPRIVRFPE